MFTARDVLVLYNIFGGSSYLGWRHMEKISGCAHGYVIKKVRGNRKI